MYLSLFGEKKKIKLQHHRLFICRTEHFLPQGPVTRWTGVQVRVLRFQQTAVGHCGLSHKPDFSPGIMKTTDFGSLQTLLPLAYLDPLLGFRLPPEHWAGQSRLLPASHGPPLSSRHD